MSLVWEIPLGILMLVWSYAILKILRDQDRERDK